MVAFAASVGGAVVTLPLQPKGRVLVLAPDRNSPPKRDFDLMFKPSAAAMERDLGATVVHVPVPTVDPKTLKITSADKQRGFESAARICLDRIEELRPAHLVFCCHGWSTGIQLGFRSAKQLGNDAHHFAELVGRLHELRAMGILRSVCLLACSTGDEPASAKESPGTGDHSLADTIRDATGAPVVAHWTAGPATTNPDLIVFDASAAPLIGGTAIQRRTALYRNGLALLKSKAPPKGDVRRAWVSLPLVTSYAELQALLSQPVA
jgi:hypothetical protein